MSDKLFFPQITSTATFLTSIPQFSIFFCPPCITKAPQLSLTHQKCSVYHPSLITFPWPCSSASQHKAWLRLSKVCYQCHRQMGDAMELSSAPPSGPKCPNHLRNCRCRTVSRGLLWVWFPLQQREAAPCFTLAPHPTAGLAPHSHLCSCPQRSQDSRDGLWARAASHHPHFPPSVRLHSSLLPILHDKFLKLGCWCRTWWKSHQMV